MANPFQAWADIIAVLKPLEGLRAVEALPRFFAAENLATFPTPTAFVGFGGERIDNTYGRNVTQTYVIWLMERNSRDIANLDTCIQLGSLVGRVDLALSDHTPSSHYTPLERVNAGDPVQYFPGGLVVYPLWYQTTFIAEPITED